MQAANLCKRVGTAGWSIPAAVRDEFLAAGSLLERYATRFSCVEINSSFYRSHRPATYERWASAVPSTFSFAVKMPKAIRHELRLVNVIEPLERFLYESSALGPKRGVVLIQLPPSLAYDAPVLADFLHLLRLRYAGSIALEPRHISWLVSAADEMLRAFGVARLAADPALPGLDEPGGDPSFRYFRWHGSPRRYYDEYGEERLGMMAQVASPDTPAWFIFDNTAAGAATTDALRFQELIATDGAARESCRKFAAEDETLR